MVRCATPTESFRWHPSHHPTPTHLPLQKEGKSASGPPPAISPSFGRAAVVCQTRRQGQAGGAPRRSRILPPIRRRCAGGGVSARRRNPHPALSWREREESAGGGT